MDWRRAKYLGWGKRRLGSGHRFDTTRPEGFFLTVPPIRNVSAHSQEPFCVVNPNRETRLKVDTQSFVCRLAARLASRTPIAGVRKPTVRLAQEASRCF